MAKPTQGDRAAETSTTTGTGTYSLQGAISSFRTIVAACGDGETVHYFAVDQAGGSGFEVGEGVITDASPDTLTRATIFASSNGGAAVDWAAGTRNIVVTLTADGYKRTSAGLHSVWFPAHAFAGGSATIEEVEASSNGQKMQVAFFDGSSDQDIFINLRMPKKWNLGALQFQLVHYQDTAGAGAVSMWMSGRSYANSDALDQAMGTAVEQVDTVGTVGDIFLGSKSGDVTVSGTPAAEELSVFKLMRDVSDGEDTLAVRNGIVGVVLFATTNINTDD